MFGGRGSWVNVFHDSAKAFERRRKIEARLDREHGNKEEYTVLEAAAFWDKDEETVRRWIRAGKIETAKRGPRKTRIPRDQMINEPWVRRR